LPVLFTLLKEDRAPEPLSLQEYERLFRDYHRAIRNFIYYRCGDRDVSDDLVQDVFVKLWENRSKIERKTVKAYLYTIAQNLTINHLKRRQLHFKLIRKPSDNKEQDTPEKLMEINEYQNKLNTVLGMLTDGGREVFLMNRLEDLTYTEIADRLSLSVKAVEKRMSKVLKILREQLGTEL
jgi:RNA polymerase sigma-70 factor (family 1)